MQLRNVLLFLFLLIASSAIAQTPEDSTWFYQHYKKIEKMIPMRDGVRLYTAIYMPTDSTVKHPILMNRTPYSCAPYSDTAYRKIWNSYHNNYVREGYIMVYQDVRGRYMSEGVFQDVRPFNAAKKTKTDIDEASDTYDAIDWLIKNVAGNNGKVGVFGISYPGFYSTMAALSGHPALKAVSPQAPVTDWFMGDDFHHNGAFMLFDGFEFYKGFGVPRPKPLIRYNKGYERKEVDAYKFYLAAGPLPDLTTKLLGDSIAFWNDMMAHPNYDAWWKARNAASANNVKGIKPAMLTVGGVFDAEDCYGAWNTYKSIEKNNPATTWNKIIMGPWFHGAWGGRSDGSNLGKVKFGSATSLWYQAYIEFPFFQYFLNGKGNTDSIKEATVFFTGANQWKQFNQWPPLVENQSLYILPNRQLSLQAPAALAPNAKLNDATGWTQYISDPANPVPHEGSDTIKSRTREYMTADQRFASKRNDVLTFTTDTLLTNTTLAGPVIADLMASISGTDADFVVKIIDVFPDDITDRDTLYASDSSMNGYQMLVRGEVLRGRFRNSFEKPEAFVPNKITKVQFTLPDVAHTFLKGHRIMVQIQSSWFPLTDRNPQTFVDIYHAKPEDFQTETIRIYHTKEFASKLILPILK